MSFVGLASDKVLVKREAKDSSPVYFELKKEIYDKIVPLEMALTFFDTTLTTFNPSDVTRLELVRRQDKEEDKFILDKEQPKKDEPKKEAPKKDEAGKDAKQKDDANVKKDVSKDSKQPEDDTKKSGDDKTKETETNPWKVVEPKDWGGKSDADRTEVDKTLELLATLHAERWVGNIKKGDPAERGLASPSIVTTVTTKVKEGDKEIFKTFTLKVGNKSKRVKRSETGYYAVLDGSDYIFVVSSNVERLLKDAEFRDRQVLKFDSAKVKELQCFILDAKGQAILNPVFKREKDKGWVMSNVLLTNPDVSAADRLLKVLSDLKAVRYLNIKPPVPESFKLDGVKVPLKFDIKMDDDKTTYQVIVGAESEKGGPYYAKCSALPNVVFLVPRSAFERVMGDLSYFSRE